MCVSSNLCVPEHLCFPFPSFSFLFFPPLDTQAAFIFFSLVLGLNYKDTKCRQTNADRHVGKTIFLNVTSIFQAFMKRTS